MKKIFTLFAVAAMAITASAQEALWLDFTSGVADSKPTIVDLYTGTEVMAPDGLKWDNGCAMYLAKEDKAYSGGNTNGTLKKPIKLSNGAPNCLVLPEGFYTNTIEVYGYANKAGEKAWIANVSIPAGDALESVYDYTEGSPVIENVTKEDWGTMELANMPKLTINLSKVVSGTIWWKNGGKQPAVYLNIIPADPASVAEIAVDENAPVEYFNLQGMRVENPANGLYIKRQGSKVTKVVL